VKKSGQREEEVREKERPKRDRYIYLRLNTSAGKREQERSLYQRTKRPNHAD
jgi:hypothetical protein